MVRASRAVILLVVGGCLLAGCIVGLPPAGIPAKSILPSMDTSTWQTELIPEYGLTFNYPAEGKLTRTNEEPSGWINEKGWNSWRIEMMSHYDFDGYWFLFYFPVHHDFLIRFAMITSSTQMGPYYIGVKFDPSTCSVDRGSAKRVERYSTVLPDTNLYPYSPSHQNSDLEAAVVLLYLHWLDLEFHCEAVNIDGITGERFSFSVPVDYPRQDIVALPLPGGRILLIHAAYRRIRSEEDLANRRKVFAKILKSVELDVDQISPELQEATSKENEAGE
ncbi:MAG: hypothetical protein SVM79_07110 [Chloroflexota bacterium]|nr:hypothetical protein [Chloroflexota bacterium]